MPYRAGTLLPPIGTPETCHFRSCNFTLGTPSLAVVPRHEGIYRALAATWSLSKVWLQLHREGIEVPPAADRRLDARLTQLLAVADQNVLEAEAEANYYRHLNEQVVPA